MRNRPSAFLGFIRWRLRNWGLVSCHRRTAIFLGKTFEHGCSLAFGLVLLFMYRKDVFCVDYVPGSNVILSQYSRAIERGCLVARTETFLV